MGKKILNPENTIPKNVQRDYDELYENIKISFNVIKKELELMDYVINSKGYSQDTFMMRVHKLEDSMRRFTASANKYDCFYYVKYYPALEELSTNDE